MNIVLYFDIGNLCFRGTDSQTHNYLYQNKQQNDIQTIPCSKLRFKLEKHQYTEKAMIHVFGEILVANEKEEFMQETQHTQQTTYPNRTKPRQENNMNVNGYKNTEDTQKQTNIY